MKSHTFILSNATSCRLWLHCVLYVRLRDEFPLSSLMQYFRIHTTPFEIILWRSIFHLQILCNWKGRKDLLWKKRHYILHPFSKLAKTLPADNFFYREYFPIKRGTSISRGKEFVTYFYLINNSDLKKIGNQNFSHNFFVGFFWLSRQN